VAALLLVGCGGSSSSSSSTSNPSQRDGSPRQSADSGQAAKGSSAKLVKHTGIAFGIFKREIYMPYKAGKFTNRGHHKLALAKARAAVAASLREVVQAKQAAQGTTALRKLFIPLGALEVSLSGLASQLKHGRSDRLDIQAANTTIAGIKAAGSSSGLRITEQAQPAAS
jgi:hypothetical protein